MMQYIPLGGADEIGASAHLLIVGTSAYLVDCGQRQTSPDQPLPDLALMQELLKGKKLAAIFLTHSHFDHIGALPLICQAYPGVPIYATSATCDLTRVLLFDSIKVMDMREGEVPLYDEKLVKEALGRLRPVPMGSFVLLPDGTKTHFFRAGHILGAAMIGMETPAGRVLFTGDFSLSGTRTIMSAALPKFSPHLVVTEATYGDRHHADRKREENNLVSKISQVINDGGHVLVPAFAQGRAQEILYLLRLARLRQKDSEKFPIWVDGLVRSVNTVYLNHANQLTKFLQKRVYNGQHPFYSDSVRAIGSLAKNEREAALAGKPGCFISSSGMLTGGASAYYAEKLLNNEKNAILLTGYQDEESPGRRLIELLDKPADEKKILLNGQEIPVKCKVEKYNLSAHADQQEIFGFLTATKPRRTILTHGQGEAREALAAALKNRLAVSLPNNGEVVELAFGQYKRSHGITRAAAEEDILAFWKNTFFSKSIREYHLDEMAAKIGCDTDSLQARLEQSSLFKEIHKNIWTPLSEEEITLHDQRKGLMEKLGNLVNKLAAVKYGGYPCMSYCISQDARGINVEIPGQAEHVYIKAEDIIGVCGTLSQNPSEITKNNWVKLLFAQEEPSVQDLRNKVLDSWKQLTGLIKPRFLCLEQNQTREIFINALKNYNLNKVGMNTETGEVILYFYFPQAVPKEINSLLLDLLKQTGWTWRINQETNMEALKSKLLQLLPEGVRLVKEPSIHREENKVKIKVISMSNPDKHQWQRIKMDYNNATGWTLEVQTETQAAVIEAPKATGGKMEINTAFNHIKNSLKAEGAEIYKTSLVEGSIRVQFITPQAAELYKHVLSKLEQETGYAVTINPEPNTSALFQKIRSIIPVKKNPSLFKEKQEIKIVVDEPIDEETKKKLERFFRETGYKVYDANRDK
ncbi:MBL fold metallo-hydrolase [Desulfitibacter alkalitolerans]|uniref:MBL fold metallo-hydrolase n=1 Tax=Desulfitibacter alkalitolerans TaxID=264641 RepID=UPI0006880B8A|nr:MBL fold metallo-hydrolase [Desulfitibacter alkalitolerans]